MNQSMYESITLFLILFVGLNIFDRFKNPESNILVQSSVYSLVVAILFYIYSSNKSSSIYTGKVNTVSFDDF